jgi:hypothetical protein
VASSPVDVCNLALKRLGASSIVALDEGTDRASLCAVLYPATRDRMLRDFEWNFAQIRISLSKSSVSPKFGFANQFPLPTLPLCLKINELDPEDAVYRIENTIDTNGVITGKAILTDEAAINVRYTAQITDVTQWDQSFVDAVAMDLAAQMAYALTESGAKAKEMEQVAAVSLSHARTTDSQENSTRQADINVLVDVRRHGFQEDFNRNQNVI